MSAKAGTGREAGVATKGAARPSEALEMSEKSGTDMIADLNMEKRDVERKR